MKKRVIWPLLLLCSSLLTALVVFLAPTISIRPLVVMWFLFICPGMAWVRLLRLHSNLAEWTIALALSIALDALVAGIFLYARAWSPASIFLVLLLLCSTGAFLQMIVDAFFIKL